MALGLFPDGFGMIFTGLGVTLTQFWDDIYIDFASFRGYLGDISWKIAKQQ